MLLFKSVITMALSSFACAVPISSEVSAGLMTSNINRLADLTNVAALVNQYVVYVHNPIGNRLATIGIVEAIGTQGTLNQDLMTGKACGSLTKRSPASIAGRASEYTLGEQANITSAYAEFINTTQAFIAIANKKHYAVVAHNASYAVGHQLNSTYGVLAAMTDTMMTALPAQKDFMTTQKDLLSASYASAIELYLSGPN